MKLFNKTDKFELNLSQEKFVQYHSSASVLSTESLAVFLSQVKDTFSGVTRTFDAGTQRFFKEVDSSRFETIARAKEVKFVNFRHEVVAKPEQFKGYYLDYAKQLSVSAETVSELVDTMLSSLKLAVSTFINEYSPDKGDILYGQKSFTEGTKLLDSEKQEVAKFFKAPAAKVRDQVQNLMRSNADFEQIYLQFDTLKKIYTDDRHAEIERHVKSTTELVDVLIDLNVKSAVLNKNDELKKQLVSAIHSTASAVEYHYALYANTLFLAKAFKELTQSLNNFHKG